MALFFTLHCRVTRPEGMTNQQPTVFVVDDNEAVREAVALSLETTGLAVESFDSAEAFLESYRPNHPGCLVLDVRMPGLNGLELQEILAAKQLQIPIIFISGHGDIPMSVRAVKAGAVDFLEKPFSGQALLDRIREALALDAEIRERESERTAIMDRLSRLTSREREVMTQLVAGPADRSSKQIAKQLGISHRTVDKYRSRIMEKMETRSLPELVAMADACGVRRSQQ